jgi:hypothetical protein
MNPEELLAAQQAQQQQTQQQSVETAADRERAAAQIPQSNQGGARELEFNPANEQPAGGAGGSSGVSDLGQQGQTGGQDWESILDVARQYGHDTTGYTDDRAFLNALLQNAQRRQQEDYYSQLGRQLAPQHEQIQQFISQQKQGQQQQGPKPWEAPTFDKSWLGMVQYDPASGIYLGKPGAPQYAVDGVNKFVQWQEKFNANPMAVVQPWAEQHVHTQVQQQVQQALASYRKEQAVNTIVAQNSDWIYQKDQLGNLLIGPGGRYVPTPNGMRYGQYINELERAGITDPHLADRYARMHLAQDLAASQQQQQQQQSPAAQRQNAIAGGRQQQNVRQSQPAPTRPVNEPNPDQAGLSLEDKLKANLEAAGFQNDSDFTYENT